MTGKKVLRSRISSVEVLGVEEEERFGKFVQITVGRLFTRHSDAYHTVSLL